MLPFLLAHLLPAQDSLSLRLASHDSSWIAVVDKIRVKTEFRHLPEVQDELQKAVDRLQREGYLEAAVDSLQQAGNDFTAWLHLGARYEWLELSAGNVEPAWLHEIHFKESVFPGTPVEIMTVRRLQDELLDFAEDHGYPFARTRLDSVEIEGHRVSAALMFWKGPLVRVDTIVMNGDPRLSVRYIYNYGGVRPGDPYSESRIAAIGKRLKELPFVRQVKPPTVVFTPDGARIDLFLQPKSVSRFNFIAGVIPNSGNNNGRLQLTADVDLDLNNGLGVGERVRFRWKNLKPRSPELDISFLYPYVAWLPVGVDARFQLYKRDSLYLDVKEELGVRFSFIGYDHIKAFVRNESSRLIFIDTAVLIASRQLPATLDWRSVISGLEVHAERLDYRFNPRRGWFLTATAGGGSRSVKRNAVIANLRDPDDSTFSFASLYDSVAVPVLRGTLALEGGGFIPLARRMTVLVQLTGAARFPEVNTLQNELIRTGGSAILRGFDEESLLASSLVMFTAEWRYLLGQNAYFRTFADMAYLRQPLNGLFIERWPLGIGLGLALETKVGVFGINYALGRLLDEDTGFRFRNAKVHLGYINYF